LLSSKTAMKIQDYKKELKRGQKDKKQTAWQEKLQRIPDRKKYKKNDRRKT